MALAIRDRTEGYVENGDLRGNSERVDNVERLLFDVLDFTKEEYQLLLGGELSPAELEIAEKKRRDLYVVGLVRSMTPDQLGRFKSERFIPSDNGGQRALMRLNLDWLSDFAWLNRLPMAGEEVHQTFLDYVSAGESERARAYFVLVNSDRPEMFK